MRNVTPPFRFDLSELIAKVRRLPDVVDGVTIKLPFISLSVKPDDKEKRIAKEIVIRMADRRVLNAFECCDDCIDHALESLHEIRRLLVDKQVELSGGADGALYLLIEAMTESIRQFSTFEQRLTRHADDRQKYFAALEMLRAHLHRVLREVASLSEIDIPKIADHMRYDAAWQLDAYIPPELPPGR